MYITALLKNTSHLLSLQQIVTFLLVEDLASMLMKEQYLQSAIKLSTIK